MTDARTDDRPRPTPDASYDSTAAGRAVSSCAMSASHAGACASALAFAFARRCGRILARRFVPVGSLVAGEIHEPQCAGEARQVRRPSHGLIHVLHAPVASIAQLLDAHARVGHLGRSASLRAQSGVQKNGGSRKSSWLCFRNHCIQQQPRQRPRNNQIPMRRHVSNSSPAAQPLGLT